MYQDRSVEIKPGTKLLWEYHPQWGGDEEAKEVIVEALAKNKKSFWIEGEGPRKARRFTCYWDSRYSMGEWPKGTYFDGFGDVVGVCRAFEEGQTIETVLANIEKRKKAEAIRNKERADDRKADKDACWEANEQYINEYSALYESYNAPGEFYSDIGMKTTHLTNRWGETCRVIFTVPPSDFPNSDYTDTIKGVKLEAVGYDDSEWNRGFTRYSDTEGKTVEDALFALAYKVW